jgi:hypothetical protein
VLVESTGPAAEIAAAVTPVAEEAAKVAPHPVEAAAPVREGVLPGQIGAPQIPKLVVRETPSTGEIGGEKIQLSLAAILRQCPREIIVGEMPTVPDSVRITLPFAPIDRQLVMGHVEISAVRFIAAIPFSYQKYFTARIGVKVPIPLEEVFQNLPNPADEEPTVSGPPPQILAPAVPDEPLIPEEYLEPTIELAPNAQEAPVADAAVADALPLESVTATSPTAAAPAATEPTAITPTATVPIAAAPAPLEKTDPIASTPPVGDAPETPMAPASAETPEHRAEKPSTPMAETAPISETVPPATSQAEPESTPAAPLELPAFHHFAPPPPTVVPEHEVEAITDIAPSGPVPEAATPTHLAPVSAETGVQKIAGEGGAATPPSEPPSEAKPAAEVLGETVPEVSKIVSEKPAEVSPAAETVPQSEVPAMGAGKAELVEAESISKEEVAALMGEVTVTKGVKDAEEITAPKAVEPAPPAVEEPAVAPAEAPSISVDGDTTQVFRLPQIIRPFIVLPPPIFAFTPTPSEGDESESQVAGDKSEGAESTQKAEERLEAKISQGAEESTDVITQKAEKNRAAISEAEAKAKAGEDKDETADEKAQVAEMAAKADDVAKVVSDEGATINIDFGQAMVPADETTSKESIPKVDFSDLPPTVAGELPPKADAVQESQALLEAAVSDRETAPVIPAAGAETAAIPAAEKPPETVVVEGQPVEPGQAPVVASSAEIFPETVAAAAAAAPKAEPEPAPAAELAPAPEVVPPTPPAAFVPPEAAELISKPPLPVIEPAVPEGTPTRVAAEDLTKIEQPEEEASSLLLHLPKIAEQFAATEILPPALPIRRFDQDALQALFMTEDVLDLAKISRLAAQLPGVHACVIATRDQACTGGTLPEGFDLAALLGLAPRVGEAAGRMPIGALKHFTLYGERYSVSFFARNGLSLCAVHRPRSFVPGVREKLVAIADELSK